MALEKSTFDNIAEVLLPRMDDPTARKALVEAALYGSEVLNGINWTGAARPFTIQLVRKLDDFGKGASGQAVIIELLTEVKKEVGTDNQAKIDDLVRQISKTKETPKRETDLTYPEHLIEDELYVFLSYAGPDEATAEQVVHYLEAAGIRVFRYTTSIPKGANWDMMVDDALRETDRMVLLCSKASMPYRKEVHREWFYYDQENKPLYPLLIEDCDLHTRIYSYNYIDARTDLQAGLDSLLQELEKHYTAPKGTADRIIIPKDTHSVEERTVPESFTALQEAVCDPMGTVLITPEQIHEIINHRPQDLTEYYLARVAEWSQPRYQLDDRFVNLTLLIDQGEDAQGERFAEQERKFDDLQEVLAERATDLAFVLKGDPGSGKSTLLRRYQLDHSITQVCNGEEQVSFFISLNQYKPEIKGEPLPKPQEWLQAQWEKKYPNLPPLETFFKGGKAFLLLDALNEMPHIDSEDYRERIGMWRDFLHDLRDMHPANRVIFSCRTLDYSASLSKKDELPVPHINIQAMDNEQIQKFLKSYLPERAEEIWDELKDTPQVEIFTTPFFLSLLVKQVGEHNPIPRGRASLFTGFVREALKREALENKNRLFQPDTLIHERDYERKLTQNKWRNSFELPGRGVLVPKLSYLAYQMQLNNLQSDGSQVRVDYDDACDWIEHDRDEDILKAGVDLNVLDDDQDEILFFHQLLQEFFAARELAEKPDPELVKSEWHVDLVTPTLEETIAQLADSDPLPQLPTTGWEETTVLASAMAKSPDDFIRGLMGNNVALAARCASQPEVTVSDGLKKELQEALLERMGNERADLRARIACGLALGNLGDPRLERKTGKYGDYWLPKWVEIEGGEYPIGTDDSDYDREKPAHIVPIKPFKMAQFPVTNAEYDLFIKASGYEDEQWWDTDAGKAWRAGDTAEGPKNGWRETRKLLQNWSEDGIWGLVTQNRITSKQAEDYITVKRWSEEQFEAWLDENFEGGRKIVPEYWNDNRFNNPGQPVVGICWHEARAYCKWLSAQTGLAIDLPTEAEWEASARGKDGRLFPYRGEFDVAKSNTFESHIRGTTPVGIYPGGATPDTNIYDLSGNVYEWTLSLYDEEKYPYPYREDGRNDLDIDRTDVRRVLRGGSWRYSLSSARAVYRSHNLPAYRNLNYGFRLILRPPSSTH